MISGTHTVADIFCCCCGQIVGWKYESACESSQKYKEGKFVLERRRIIDSMDSELCIDTRASTNMKPRTGSSAIQPPRWDEFRAQIQSFMERILAQLGSLQTLVASFDSELVSFESRAAEFEVELDGIYTQLLEWMGQHGLIPEPYCACTDPISVQSARADEDATHNAAEPSPGPSRMDELRKKMLSVEEEVLANSRSLQTTIGSIYGWLGSLDSPVADPANDDDATTHTDDDTARPSSRPSWRDEFRNQISSFEECALAHFGSLQASIGSINSRLGPLDSRVTGLEVKLAELKVKLDGIPARLPPGPPSIPPQAP
nr:protein yippee-like At5g53940 [Ipomoea batatas]